MADIFFEGRIYTGCRLPIIDITTLQEPLFEQCFKDWKYYISTLDFYECPEPNPFKDGQDCTGLYKLKYQIDNSIPSGKEKVWVDCSKEIFKVIIYPSKRIVAVPLPNEGDAVGKEAERKAEKLIEKFWHEISGVPAHCGVDVHSEDDYVILAKQCALICVDEILYNLHDTGCGLEDSIINHWQQVRTHITNL